jgi:hypothetical protein
VRGRTRLSAALGIEMIKDRVHWWASRRRRYNAGLLVAGAVSFISYVAIAWTWNDYLPCVEITAFTVVFQVIGFLFAMLVANVFYQLGPFAERIVEPKSPERFRRRIFTLGFWFSVSLLFIVPAVALLPVLGLAPVSSCD